MKFSRLPLLAFLLPLVAFAAERPLKIDRSRSYIEVDVKNTLRNFTAHLDVYDIRVNVDDAGKIKNAVLEFKFADLRTGDDQRNAAMLKWLGGGDATGKFELGILALAPDGQGQVTGKLSFHNSSKLIEFPINVARSDADYTITGSPSIDYREWDLKVIKTGFVLKVGPDLTIRFKLVGAPAEPPVVHG
jgi:polyisoprenoid-binding protein YceI